MSVQKTEFTEKKPRGVIFLQESEPKYPKTKHLPTTVVKIPSEETLHGASGFGSSGKREGHESYTRTFAGFRIKFPY